MLHITNNDFMDTSTANSLLMYNVPSTANSLLMYNVPSTANSLLMYNVH